MARIVSVRTLVIINNCLEAGWMLGKVVELWRNPDNRMTEEFVMLVVTAVVVAVILIITLTVLFYIWKNTPADSGVEVVDQTGTKTNWKTWVVEYYNTRYRKVGEGAVWDSTKPRQGLYTDEYTIRSEQEARQEEERGVCAEAGIYSL